MKLQVAQILAQVIGSDRVRIQAYDGSAAGPEDAAVRVVVRSELAMRYLAASPGELGLARAYVTGELDVEGDLYSGLLAIAERPSLGGMSLADKAKVLQSLGPGVLKPPPVPPQEVVPGTRLAHTLAAVRLHSKPRDSAAISHHYDVSNRFYRWVLGPSMAYTCACYPTETATLEEAQAEKFDLVCRKLALRPGMRLLDVGCGWGGMVRHAVRNYGVTALGVTLSRQQAEWAQKAIADDGLSGAEVRWSDYRDVRESGFDAVSSIGLTEHIGRSQLAGYFRFLHSKLRDGGLLLNHCIMKPTTTGSRKVNRGFINRYVFPDGELLGLGTVVTAMQNRGFEIRHEENLREHYAKTLQAWGVNLEEHWDEAVAEVGIGTARVWRLYMAGSRLGFDRNDLQLHQVLGVKTPRGGAANLPLRPWF
ncbi:MAG TPA: class I SAM-dependent methyltransferase [Mycobacteriales bacterium]|jgi:cyclopropane-fatty-acyl-phospholipid synthase|nr:class I SAM-dependent methyltransferase [Mycobacteriales bacterium]